VAVGWLGLRAVTGLGIAVALVLSGTSARSVITVRVSAVADRRSRASSVVRAAVDTRERRSRTEPTAAGAPAEAGSPTMG
jgi:hypothetical protein